LKIFSKIWRDRMRWSFGVPYCVPAWGWAEHWAIVKCLVSGRVIDGEDIKKLLDSMREKTGARYAFGFNSGREAILAALKAAGIGHGDRVIMPSYCCETVALAVLGCGAEPVFCDIDADLNPDGDHISQLIDDTTKAIVFPHLFGKPAAIDELEANLEKAGLRERIFLVDDAAQSFGARLNGKLLGSFGDCGIVSFGPGKTMTATGGGLLLTNSEQLAQKLQKISVAKYKLTDKIRKIAYWVAFRRWRKFTRPFYRFVKGMFEKSGSPIETPTALCNIDAAIASVQMKKLDAMIDLRKKRRRIIDDIRRNIVGGDFLRPVINTDTSGTHVGTGCVFTKYVLTGNNQGEGNHKLAELYRRIFEGAGVEIFPLYQPIHLKARYLQYATSLTNTERISAAVFQVPLEPSLSDREFGHVIDTYRQFLMKALPLRRTSESMGHLS